MTKSKIIKQLEIKGEKNISFRLNGVVCSAKRGMLNYWEVLDNQLIQIDSKEI